MCSNFLFQFSILPRILPPIENKSRHTDAKGDYAESSRNASKRNELRENERISCESIAKFEDLDKRFLNCVQHVCTCATLVYLIRTYIITYVYIYIFFLYVYIFCMCTCVYVFMYVYVCMCYGSAEDTRTRFSKLLRLRRMRENETYISDSRGKRFTLSSSNVVSMFVFSQIFPATFFLIDSTTHRI